MFWNIIRFKKEGKLNKSSYLNKMGAWAEKYYSKSNNLSSNISSSSKNFLSSRLKK